jgi:hypothetical protein
MKLIPNRRMTLGILLALALPSHGARYVVSTITEFTSALGSVTAGDTILVHAGTYASTKNIALSKSGTSSKKINVMVYPGDERPLFNFSGNTGRGFSLSGDYWYIKGIRIQGAGDNGMMISGDNNIVEYCEFFENGDSGCQLGGGATNNQVINCDSYYNIDPGEGNADGFSPKLDVGTGNYFKGCRSWQNSDDGYDGYLRPADDVTTTYEECWCYKNGYRKNGTASSGNGNGFKMGGSDAKNLRHNAILKNCLAVGNRVKGFDQNNDKGSMTLYNCTAFSNGINYQINGTILASGKSLTLTNCVSAGGGAASITGGTVTMCSWSSGFSVSNADFLSIDSSVMTGARKADGSLPDITFMHLAPSSKLIDAGTPITGMAYNGAKPDLGCFETGSAGVYPSSFRQPVSMYEIIPTASAGIFKIIFPAQSRTAMSLSLFDMSGKRIKEIGRAGFDYIVDFRGIGRGNYVCKIGSETGTLALKILVK